MTDKVMENNQVVIMGKVIGDFTFSHEIFGEGFYMLDVEVARLSEVLRHHPSDDLGETHRRGRGL